MEFGVHAARGAVVEARHGLLQRGGVHADLRRQRGQRVRAANPAGRVRADGLPRDGRAVAAVHDEPGGQVVEREAARVEGVEGVPDGVVVGRLVHEAAALAVDDDGARPGAFAQDEARVGLAAQLVAGHAQGGNPPRLAHVAQGRARAHGHEQAVALVLGRGGGGRHGAAQEGPHQLAVPLEAAAGDDHGLARAHEEGRALALGPHPHDRAVAVEDELARSRGRMQGNLAVERSLQQRAHERLSVAAQVARAPRRQLVRVQPREADRVRLQHGHGIGGRVGMAVDARRPRPQLLEREEVVVERAPAPRLAARILRVVVGIAREDVHGEGRALLQVAQHLRRGVDEGGDQLGVHGAEREGVEVGEGVLARIGDARRGHVVVVRNPEHAAGDGAAPAHRGRALQQDRLGPVVAGEDGGGGGGRSGAQHRHVRFEVPAFGRFHGYRGMLPCFRGGLRSALFRSISSAVTILPRVSRGSITSSTKPRPAGM